MANFLVDGNAVGAGYSFAPSGQPEANTDRLLDPVTLDYVRTENGEWAETPDSRTLVMIALDLEFGASPFSPGDGTTIAELRRSGAPITPDEVVGETLRIGEALRRAGILADFEASILTDANGAQVGDGSGRVIINLSYRDLASGSPVDLRIRG